MKICRYNDQAKNVLKYQHNGTEQEVHGGETFECSDEMAEELLTAPYVDVTLVRSRRQTTTRPDKKGR